MESELFADKSMLLLAAISNGLIDSDFIIEVKCPLTAARHPPASNITKLTKLRLKEDERYMYQIQGQLHIALINACYFVIWTPLGMLVQKMERVLEFR
ncbi:hypothetical protein PR048_011150 [Dryococelus australis]|uniref:YqaJ viral recombinase domain-containing protein n=1 Tax=Dryococelus australis TaxID=614101 RepID=A0ABQ9HKT6_9NEOP|nr:hypothetical protein PR048_011150 [Dryococelus australis]